MPISLKNVFKLFEDRKIRVGVVGASFLLHALAGVLMIKLSKDSPFSTWPQLVASFSLIPIILLAEDFKKLVAYLLVAVSPMPIFIFLLLAMVMLVDVFRKGFAHLSTKDFEMLISSPLLLTFMFLLIVWPYLLGALGLRVLVRVWLARTA